MQEAPKDAASAWTIVLAALRMQFNENDSEIARQIGVSRQALFKWKQVPIERVPRVAELSGISAHRIRPDLPALFPPPARAPEGA